MTGWSLAGLGHLELDDFLHAVTLQAFAMASVAEPNEGGGGKFFGIETIWERPAVDSVHTSKSQNSAVLVLTLAQNERSWGRGKARGAAASARHRLTFAGHNRTATVPAGRSHVQYLELVAGLILGSSSMSLGLLLDSTGEYHKLACVIQGLLRCVTDA